MPETPVGGSSTVQQLLREAEASLGGGIFKAAPRAVRREVRQGLEQKIDDPGARARYWLAFEQCFAQVDLQAADTVLEQLRVDRESRRALRDEPEAPTTVTTEPAESCVTILAAAVRLGLEPDAMRARVNRGTVRSFLVSHRRLIPVAEVERLELEAVAA